MKHWFDTGSVEEEEQYADECEMVHGWCRGLGINKNITFRKEEFLKENGPFYLTDIWLE